MEKQKLIYVESKAQFSPSEVSDKAIVFIKDTKEIWTHGVYFSCSGAWASPITLSLTGDTTGSVSIDGSGNASITTTTYRLSSSDYPKDANTAYSTRQDVVSYYRINSDSSNLFPASNNANGILSLNVHGYSHTHQLGFSSDGNIYHRRRNEGTWETTWKTILNSSNYTNFLDSVYLKKSGDTMTGALNFANNTWNKVGDDAYMGNCNVAGMIGIKGSNADIPGFAMYNTAGTLLGKLYTNNSKNLYWTDNLILTSNNYESYINSSLYEANLKWGGKNFAGNFGPLDAALISPLGPNRFAFLSPEGITVEYSTDSGATWTDYGLDNEQKVNLLNGNHQPIAIGHNTENSTTVNRLPHQVRVIITTSKCSIYTELCKFAIFITRRGNNGYCRIDARLQQNVVNNVDTWKVFSDSPISGDSGWNILNTSPITTYGNTVSTQYGQVRFTFYITSQGSNSWGLKVHSILGYGGQGWATASNMARIGHLYSYDGYQNAIFPARIVATGFSGPLTGNADTASFLKCPDKRYSYPAQIVTSGGNIGATFTSASKLGLSDGGYYEAIILRGWIDSSGGNENALLFSKNTSSVYHSQYAFGSTTTWGTMYKFLDSNNYSSYALPLSGGTMTGPITLTSGSDSAYDKSALSFIKSSDKSEQARIGTNTTSGLGMYAKGAISIRPNVTLGSDSTNGLVISSSSFTYNGNAVLTSSNYTKYTIGYVNSSITYGNVGVIADGKLHYNSALSFARFSPSDNSGETSYELIAELINYGTGTNTQYITYGISGFMWSTKAGDCANSSAYPITAIVSIGPYTFSRIRVPITTHVLIPFIVKYNDKYYIALRKIGAAANLYFMGQKLNLLTTTIIVDDASLIEEIKGPEVETSTAMYYYNNGTPQQYLHAGNYSSYAIKVDGTNGTSNGVSTLLNKLITSTDTPTDADYYICQYAGGGTTTTSYHRRPMSAMYAYIKSKAKSDFLPLSGGTLGSSTASDTQLFIKSSTANLRLLAYSDSTNYIQSGNSDFSGSATLRITGYYNNTGTNLYFNFANIYCRAGNYTNIDSGNYSSYALPLSGGTLTGTLISRDIRPSANLSYSLGTSSYYYNYVYANYFKKNGSSDSYVLLGGGGHKAVSDFVQNYTAIVPGGSVGNNDSWTLILNNNYSTGWYGPCTMFYIRSKNFGCGILCFYHYWNTEQTSEYYDNSVWFFGAEHSAYSDTMGGTGRDINSFLKVYIDKDNDNLKIYYNRYNNQSMQIQELQFLQYQEGTLYPKGQIRASHFITNGAVTDLPITSSTFVNIPIQTTKNHTEDIKTTRSVYASAFYENSDIRLKENVHSIDQVDLLKNVDLVQFNFKNNQNKKYGVIAQQLEQVGLNNLVYEHNGNKAVDYISLLVLEIQRLRNEIGELKQEINKKS